MTPALLIVATLCAQPPLLASASVVGGRAIAEQPRTEPGAPGKATQAHVEGTQPRRDAMPPDDLASLVIASVVGSVMLSTLIVAVVRQMPQPCTATLGCLGAP